jgi:hypothetical protein
MLRGEEAFVGDFVSQKLIPEERLICYNSSLLLIGFFCQDFKKNVIVSSFFILVMSLLQSVLVVVFLCGILICCQSIKYHLQGCFFVRFGTSFV